MTTPRFVYQLESIRPALDLRTMDYVTIGMFDSPALARYRVSRLTKTPELKKYGAYAPGKNDNEFVVRHGNMFYRITRHCLQSTPR